MADKKHALLSASSAHRWLKCTAAPHYELQFPATTSDYAEEGTLAHELCEIKALRAFTPQQLTQRAASLRISKIKKHALYNPEMARTSDAYVEKLQELSMSYASTPYVAVEVQVRYDDYVPDGFGTCDCIIIGGDTLTIVDYKHGKGVPVSAVNNPQMRLYALGALSKYNVIYGGTIKYVQMVIVQPRVSSDSNSERITVEELRSWGDSIKDTANAAYNGNGQYVPGEHCKFCRGKGACKARAASNMALSDFKDIIPADNILDGDAIGDLLVRGKELVSWYKDLEDYALKTLLAGGTVPGWKVVEGRSNRAFTNTEAAINAAIEAGYDRAVLYNLLPKTLTEIEKLMGKAEFAEQLGDYVVKPPGKPTLVPITDARKPYSPAANDFADLNKNDKGV